MSHDPYAEKLATFKENEKPEVVLLLADDPEMIKLIIAWTSIAASPARELSPLEGATESEVWDWLWQNTTYSRRELSAKSSIPVHQLDRKLRPLIGNEVIYPDGTVNSFVQRHL